MLQSLQYMSAYFESHPSLVAIPAVEYSQEDTTQACLHDLHAAYLCVSDARVIYVAYTFDMLCCYVVYCLKFIIVL